MPNTRIVRIVRIRERLGSLTALLRRVWRGLRRPQPERAVRRPILSPGANRGVIGLGDLLRALGTLEVSDDAIAARVSRCLGFAQRDPNPPERLRGAFDRTRSPHRRHAPTPAPAPPLGAPPFSGQAPPPDLPASALQAELTPLDPTPGAERPDWLDAAPRAEPASATRAQRAPLFPRRTATALVCAAVATRRPGSEPDVPRLIAALVRGNLSRELPCLPVAGLDRGIQLLLDWSEAMTPFRQDLADLAQVLEQVVGRARCQVFHFTGEPATATRWDASGVEKRWLPERGRPVVLATDFGAGAPPAGRDRVLQSTWLAFARQVRKAGCPLVAFVPLPPARWPLRLSREITLIHWDPRTTAGAVRRLVGAGHAVCG